MSLELSPLGPDAFWAAQDFIPWMEIALDEAAQAATAGEAPVGAVLIGVDTTAGSSTIALFGRGRNNPIGLNDPTAHAEILCLRQAAAKLGNYRTPNTVLVTTLEPCLMCLGALVHARVSGLVIGARDPKSGAVLSQLDGTALPFLNHRLWVLDGILADRCSALLSTFFQRRRTEKKAEKTDATAALLTKGAQSRENRNPDSFFLS